MEGDDLMAMIAATESRLHRSDAKLLVMDRGQVSHQKLYDLPDLLDYPCVIVVNDAGTIPAMLSGITSDGKDVEIRLVYNPSSDGKDIRVWKAMTFGSGDWKTQTEDRQLAPVLQLGDVLTFGPLQAEVMQLDQEHHQLITIKFHGEKDRIWHHLMQVGHPIQYSHLTMPLQLWDVQTIFSSHPVAMEAPSASFQFTWELMALLQQQGATIVPITNATSVSDTGDIVLNQRLPFPEHYWIPAHSASILNDALASYIPIIALGTSVTRTLESNFMHFGKLQPGHFVTSLKIDQNTPRHVVDHLITGMHLPESSHLLLLENFSSRDAIMNAYQEAQQYGYLWHEYGDLTLILSGKQQASVDLDRLDTSVTDGFVL